MWASLFGTIGTLIALFVVRKKYPANFYLLGAFTYDYTIPSLTLVFLKHILLERLLHSMIRLSSLRHSWSQLVFSPDLHSSHFNQNGISLAWDLSCLEGYGLSFLLDSLCCSSHITGIFIVGFVLIWQRRRGHLLRHRSFDLLPLHHLRHLQYLQHVASWRIHRWSYQSVLSLSEVTDFAVTLTSSTFSWTFSGSWTQWIAQIRCQVTEVLIAWISLWK